MSHPGYLGVVVSESSVWAGSDGYRTGLRPVEMRTGNMDRKAALLFVAASAI